MESEHKVREMFSGDPQTGRFFSFGQKRERALFSPHDFRKVILSHSGK